MKVKYFSNYKHQQVEKPERCFAPIATLSLSLNGDISKKLMNSNFTRTVTVKLNRLFN